MQIPSKMTDSVTIYNVKEGNDTINFSVGPAWLVVYGMMAAIIAGFLWTVTALVYWFVFMYGVVAGLV